MLDQTTKRKIDTARDILVGKVPDPKQQVDQITNALIYKFMDDMDKESQELGGEAKFFTDEFEKYSWTKLLDKRLSGQERLDLFSQAIANMPRNPHIPQLFRDVFKGAFLPYRDPETLSLFLKEIDSFTYDHSEDLGDAFEYLLSVLGSQGDAGQFRTPRHIIDFIVEVVDPKKNETILDPACGTAGFLISAYKHILSQHDGKDNQTGQLTIDETRLTPDDRKRLMNNFVGYDISPDMVKLSLVNLYLHGFPEPKIFEYDTLTSEKYWDDQFDVIMANPPFMTPKGGIRPHNRFTVSANRSEVLFVSYIMDHLNLKGRAGIIVPEGIIFQSANAYKDLRKKLIEDGLFAVVSLPPGIFNPYSGVKTSILFFDNTLAKLSSRILFLGIGNDGFSLGAQRSPIKGNQIPEVQKIIAKFKDDPNISPVDLQSYARTIDLERILSKGADWVIEPLIVEKSKINESGDYNLTWSRYKETDLRQNQKWPMVELGEVCEIYQPKTITSKEIKQTGKYKVFGANGVIGFYDKYNHEDAEVLITCRGATCGTVNMSEAKSWITGNAMVVKPKDNLDKNFLFYFLRNTNLKSVISGSAQPQITRASLSPFKIPLPPLEVQKQIVEQIEGYQKIIDGAKQITSSWKPKIDIDPEWEMVKLSVISENHDNKRKPVTKSNRSAGKFPYYGASGIVDYVEDYIFDGDYLLISEDGANLLARNTPIAFSISGKNWVNNHAHILKFKDSSTQKFVEIYINEIDISNFVTGMAQPKLNQQALNTIEIPLPPLEVQKQIVEKVEEEWKIVEGNKRLVEIYEKKIEEVINKI